jgi:hypothetical protein
MWFLLQGLIMFAVMATNVAWHWTPNALIPALLGGGIAYGLTYLLTQRRGDG